MLTLKYFKDLNVKMYFIKSFGLLAGLTGVGCKACGLEYAKNAVAQTGNIQRCVCFNNALEIAEH